MPVLQQDVPQVTGAGRSPERAQEGPLEPFRQLVRRQARARRARGPSCTSSRRVDDDATRGRLSTVRWDCHSWPRAALGGAGEEGWWARPRAGGHGRRCRPPLRPRRRSGRWRRVQLDPEHAAGPCTGDGEHLRRQGQRGARSRAEALASSVGERVRPSVACLSRGSLPLNHRLVQSPTVVSQ